MKTVYTIFITLAILSFCSCDKPEAEVVPTPPSGTGTITGFNPANDINGKPTRGAFVYFKDSVTGLEYILELTLYPLGGGNISNGRAYLDNTNLITSETKLIDSTGTGIKVGPIAYPNTLHLSYFDNATDDRTLGVKSLTLQFDKNATFSLYIDPSDKKKFTNDLQYNLKKKVNDNFWLYGKDSNAAEEGDQQIAVLGIIKQQ